MSKNRDENGNDIYRFSEARFLRVPTVAARNDIPKKWKWKWYYVPEMEVEMILGSSDRFRVFPYLAGNYRILSPVITVFHHHI